MEMELDSLATSVGGLFGLTDVVGDLKDIGILGGGAAAAIIGAQLAFTKIGFLASKSSKVQGAIAVGVGAALGIGLGNFVHKGLGAGVGAGMVGFGLGKLAMAFIPQLNGLGAANDELLLGISSSDYQPIPGQMNGVTDYNPGPGSNGGVGSWMNS